MRAFQKIVYSIDDNEFSCAKETLENLKSFKNNDKMKKYVDCYIFCKYMCIYIYIYIYICIYVYIYIYKFVTND